ncbi:trichohyalin-like isoform X1 [Cuculus canorus]|uniref:trichohyalin-like isoform X1 n=2 Tax=Cuculus canorus TaxID=55661 RepID=UPI0023AA76E3|nr:trichohyalin-like isoform X1 [Cuculus canorus]XP_053911566.1 trichohyalin-like isoform X1 [Cuculus canorus]XP_053911567.1 trichohyalin-like isoform X1 [Cuculus canorus]XP_053911568.1 trichohyalin-like isoform X1 [Cuculus canorus]XP_053911569.1 trichohyalin-like isoform X1 [Cuculus canorus]XP_053911570.1 trichohyalin-like isoform X1 [Cuculus canorus]XP_053911571.1 trichohyalin-like isoform X1 [Cuculus canorus]
MEQDNQRDQAVVLGEAVAADPLTDSSDTMLEPWLQMQLEEVLLEEHALEQQTALASSAQEDSAFDQHAHWRLLEDQLRVCKTHFCFRDVMLDAIPAAVGLLGCCWIYSHRKKQANGHEKKAIGFKEEQQEELHKKDSSLEPAAGVSQSLPLSSEEKHPDNEPSTSLLATGSMTLGSIREKRREELEMWEKELTLKEAHLAQQNEELKRAWQDLQRDREELKQQKASFHLDLENLRVLKEEVELEKAQFKQVMEEFKRDQEELQLQKVSFHLDQEGLCTAIEEFKREKEKFRLDMERFPETRLVPDHSQLAGAEATGASEDNQGDFTQEAAEELQARVAAGEERSYASTHCQTCEALQAQLAEMNNANTHLAEENAHLRRQMALTEEVQAENAHLKSKLAHVEVVENKLVGRIKMAEWSQELEKEREETKSTVQRKSEEGRCLQRAQTEEHREHKEALQAIQAKLTELNGRFLKHDEQCRQFFQELEQLEK